MSYQTAKAELVSIVEDVLPTDDRLLGEGLKFVHLVEGRTGIKCRSRSFWIEANTDGDGGVTGPYTPDLQGQPRQTYSVALTVSYKLHERRGVLDEVMAADQLAYSRALLTQGFWVTTTSKILNLTADPIFLPTRRTFLDDSVEQRTSMTLLFR